MNQLLNAKRLLQLKNFDPKLHNIWYLVAAATFSVCNEPQELPKLYYYVIMSTQLNKNNNSNDMELAKKAIDIFQYKPHMVKEKVNSLYLESTDLQRYITNRFREALLKTSILGGLPKAINALMELKNIVPDSLQHESLHISKLETSLDTLFQCTKRSVDKSINSTVARGMNHWNLIYDKVSEKVINNLNSSYPDLWYYTMAHAYGPLLSFESLLNAQETSYIIIASLIPQDVNPQLKGHLKGAINVGCDKMTVEAVRSMSIMIAKWCGINWKSEIVKL